MRVSGILTTPQFGNTVKNGDSFQCMGACSKNPDFMRGMPLLYDVRKMNESAPKCAFSDRD